MSLKIRRGTNTERLTIIPAEGELIYTTDTKNLYIGDGLTSGGKFITGPGYTGSAGSVTVSGYTGSAGSGYTGSASTVRGYAGSAGSDGSNGYTGSASSGYTGSAGQAGGTLRENLNTSTYNITNGSNLTINGSTGTISAQFLSAVDRITFNENAVISSNATSNNLNINTSCNFVTTSTNFSAPWITFYGLGNSASSQPVSFGRNRGTPINILPLQLNDEIAVLNFGARDGGGAPIGARIKVTVDNTVSTGVLPSKIILSTANSAGSLVDSIKINSNQIEMAVPPIVPVYANNTARDAAIPTPIKGMLIVVDSTFYGYNGTIWKQLDN